MGFEKELGRGVLPEVGGFLCFGRHVERGKEVIEVGGREGSRSSKGGRMQ